MATIANLSVSLTANTSRFSRGMRRGTRRVEAFRDRVRATSAVVRRFAGALVAAAGVAGIGFFIRQQFKLADSLSKTSTRLGIQIEELQKLQFAGEQTGVNMRTLELGIQRMTRRIAEAAQGTGEARAAIAELGLDARKLSETSPDVALRAIAEAMSRVTNQSDKVRLAFKLFDSEGVSLLNTLELGAAGIDRLGRQLESTGAIVSQRTASQFERLNDQLNVTRKALIGAALVIARIAAPFVVAFAEKISELARKFQNSYDTILANVKTVVKWSAALTAAILLAPRIVRAVLGIISVLRAFTAAQTLALSVTPGGLAKLAIGGVVAGGALLAVDKAFDKISSSVKTAGSEMAGFEQELVRQNELFERFASKVGEAGAAVDESLTKSIGKASQEIDQTIVKAEKLNRQFEKPALPRLLEAGSREAVGFLNQQRINQQGRAADRIAELNRDQLAEAKRQTTILDDLRDRSRPTTTVTV